LTALAPSVIVQQAARLQASAPGRRFKPNLDLVLHVQKQLRVDRAETVHARLTSTALAVSQSALRNVSLRRIALGSSLWRQQVVVLRAPPRSLVAQVKTVALPTLIASARGQIARRIVRRLKIAHGPKVSLTLAGVLRVRTLFLVVRASIRALPISIVLERGRSVQSTARKLRIARGRKLSRRPARVQVAR
jgi:hypothetical protein